MPSSFTNTPEIRRAFAEYDRQSIINNVKVGCWIGMLLMPAGVVLDYFVYRSRVGHFFILRLACSALIAIFWAVVDSPAGRKHPRVLGVLLAMFPTSFISWMIFVTEGSVSPYYAGLNLVLLVIGFVLYWTLIESLIAVSLVVLMYVGACIAHGHISQVAFANNLYFLALTGVIVVTGSYVHSHWRFREFALRFELDQNKKALEESNQKLVELDQIKSRFFANISHELRTPLTLLLSPLETLLHQPRSPLDAASRNLLGIMHANGMRLLKLINDLLELVRLESGRLEVKREPMEINAFIKGLTAATQQMAQAKQIRLEMSAAAGMDAILADRDKLEKVFLNLIFNALKFTPKDGLVELRARREGENLVVTVRDTGVGIAAKSLPHVFDRFWQADNSSNRKFQGVGIGLSLVKELTELHGGTVTVVSQEGQGTTFTVSIPYLIAETPPAETPAGREAAAAVPAAAPAGAVPAAQSDEWLVGLYRRAELFPAIAPPLEAPATTDELDVSLRARLLLADDEPDMRRFLKSQLTSYYRVIEAEDGKQAVEKATGLLPDIILLDMNMPEKDGLQVCRELRAQATTQKIPIIMLTARADEATKLTALSAGANDFLGKPFSTTELHVRIKNLLESHEYQTELAKQNQALASAIGQLKETESQLVQSEKLASLGRMSAGIIHEINNPLNYANQALYTLKQKSRFVAAEQQAEYADIIQDVEDGLKRVMNIVSDLRPFAHHDGTKLETVKVTEVMGSALRFLSHELRETVQLEKYLDEEQTVTVNKNKLIQVCVNLLQNSLDALRQKQFANGEKPTVRVESRVENGRSLMIIRDNGPGIEAEHLNKIFDPFFTTKDVGQGMGLGLSICYRIVKEADGRIQVRSEPGKFCEFTLEFPLKEGH
ncbi:MAG TPA: ATP-binding protein [Dongiaceae bacterium]|nr:ATP-binding protein [Dongiaceae bacterium]